MLWPGSVCYHFLTAVLSARQLLLGALGRVRPLSSCFCSTRELLHGSKKEKKLIQR